MKAMKQHPLLLDYPVILTKVGAEIRKITSHNNKIFVWTEEDLRDKKKTMEFIITENENIINADPFVNILYIDSITIDDNTFHIHLILGDKNYD